MIMNKKPFPLATLCSLEKKIDPTPDYQRPPAWSTKQKQLLIDSILQEYDIPKMYWRKVRRDDGIIYEVIDGQQRLRAIWEYKAGVFSLASDAETINGIACAGKKYDELDVDLRIVFDAYPVDVVVVETTDENDTDDEIRDMFLRLQNGTTLKAQEKRNAMPGQMRNFVKTIADHPFFASCNFTNKRFTFDQVAAQLICLEREGGPTNVKDGDLNRMYKSCEIFDTSSKLAKKVKRVLDYLKRAFPEKTPELERYNAINLYCLASILIEKYVYENTESKLSSWFIDFETKRRENDLLPEEERDSQLIEYRRLTSYSTDGIESIRSRLEFLEKSFFLEFPDIRLKDEDRSFTEEQRLAIFRKNAGCCQIRIHCSGEKLAWNDWHADHIVPFSRGGPTTVENGQVACQRCNLAKSNNYN